MYNICDFNILGNILLVISILLLVIYYYLPNILNIVKNIIYKIEDYKYRHNKLTGITPDNETRKIFIYIKRRIVQIKNIPYVWIHNHFILLLWMFVICLTYLRKFSATYSYIANWIQTISLLGIFLQIKKDRIKWNVIENKLKSEFNSTDGNILIQNESGDSAPDFIIHLVIDNFVQDGVFNNFDNSWKPIKSPRDRLNKEGLKLLDKYKYNKDFNCKLKHLDDLFKYYRLNYNKYILHNNEEVKYILSDKELRTIFDKYKNYRYNHEIPLIKDTENSLGSYKADFHFICFRNNKQVIIRIQYKYSDIKKYSYFISSRIISESFIK